MVEFKSDFYGHKVTFFYEMQLLYYADPFFYFQ